MTKVSFIAQLDSPCLNILRSFRACVLLPMSVTLFKTTYAIPAYEELYFIYSVSLPQIS